MNYKKVKIYFSSGTGNSYRVAVWVHEFCQSKDIDSEVIPIDIADPKSEIDSSPDNLVVLTFPTHGLLPPWSMIKFIFRMPFKKSARIFALPTRGSFLIGPLLVPGIAGYASILPILVSLFKGYHPKGSLSLDMPANVISIHSRLSDWKIDRIKRGAKSRVERHFSNLLNGGSVWFTLNNLWEYFWSILLLRYWPLWTIAYLLLGRFFMGKVMFANNKCISCGVCAETCPNNAIAMLGKENPRPLWRYNCEHCLRCMNYCRQKAVEAGHSWGVLLYFLCGFPLALYIFRYAWGHYPVVKNYYNYWTFEIVNCIYYYPVIIIAYYIFYQLIRVRFINSIFTYTTLTRIFRRYHEPETSLNDLQTRKK